MLQRLVDAAAVEAEIERVRSLSDAALRRRIRAQVPPSPLHDPLPTPSSQHGSQRAINRALSA
jgi:hypothetical protein